MTGTVSSSIGHENTPAMPGMLADGRCAHCATSGPETATASAQVCRDSHRPGQPAVRGQDSQRASGTF